MTLKLDRMQEIFNAPNEYFESLGVVRIVNDRKHIFIDNGADVLAVAHLDSVNDLDHFYPLHIAGKDIVLSSRCDDRLGVYVLLEMLPEMGCKYDILLTDEEEDGKSTGADFVPTKQYNWMFQFDRRLDDAVTYMYNGLDWKNALKENFKVGHGSASDISKMEHLKCSGVNVGTGYDNEHDPLALFFIDLLISQVDKFVSFYTTNRDIHYPYEKTVYTPPAYTGYQYQQSHYYPPANQPALPSTVMDTCDSCFRKFKRLELSPVQMGTTTEEWCDECLASQEVVKCDCCLTHSFGVMGVLVGEAIEFWCPECRESIAQYDKLDEGHYETKPTHCSSCERELEGSESDFFIGICSVCEDDVYECQGCGHWIRQDAPACASCIEKLEVVDVEPFDLD